MYEIKVLNRRDKWEKYWPIKARSPKQAVWFLVQKAPGLKWIWSIWGTDMLQVKDISGIEQGCLF
jgi:hypothetical protein